MFYVEPVPVSKDVLKQTRVAHMHSSLTYAFATFVWSYSLWNLLVLHVRRRSPLSITKNDILVCWCAADREIKVEMALSLLDI
jgi:hypothetical protein